MQTIIHGVQTHDRTIHPTKLYALISNKNLLLFTYFLLCFFSGSVPCRVSRPVCLWAHAQAHKMYENERARVQGH